MGIWSKLFPQKRSVTYQTGLESGLVPQPSIAGVTVNEQTALGLSAVWCGVRTISQDVGSLCPVVYRQSDATRTSERNHPVARLLRQPNPESTRPVVYETLMAHALLFGNCYAEVERAGSGQPVNLWPLHPRNVTVLRTTDGELVYRVVVPAADPDRQREPYQVVYVPAADMIHVPGLSPDGTVGYQLLAVARDTLSFGIAANRFGAAWFGNSHRPGSYLTTPNALPPEAVANIQKSFEQYRGPDRAGKMMVLEGGLDFKTLAQTNEQGQVKDLLNYIVYEVARLLNCPPSKLHDLSKATWGNLESLNQDYLSTTLRPWLEKFECEFEKKLLSPGERDVLDVEFDTTGLLRADIAGRTAYYVAALQNQWMTRNEVRVREGLAPLAGGDEFEKPAASTPTTPVADDEGEHGE